MHVTRSYSNHTYRSSNFEAKNCHLDAQTLWTLSYGYEISIHVVCVDHDHTYCTLQRVQIFYDLLNYSELSQAVHNYDTWDTTWDTFSERPKRSHTLANKLSQTPEHPTGTWPTEDTAHAIEYHYTTQILYTMHVKPKKPKISHALAIQQAPDVLKTLPLYCSNPRQPSYLEHG